MTAKRKSTSVGSRRIKKSAGGKQHELIREAISCLKLKNIRLFSSSFDRSPIKNPDGQMYQQFMRHVDFDVVAPRSSETEKEILFVMVMLGTRLVTTQRGTLTEDTVENIKEEDVFAKIEASFVVEYIVNREIKEEALSAFSEFNAVHNVWPFWRQHVFDIVSRSGLPKLEIPLFSGKSA